MWINNSYLYDYLIKPLLAVCFFSLFLKGKCCFYSRSQRSATTLILQQKLLALLKTLGGTADFGQISVLKLFPILYK